VGQATGLRNYLQVAIHGNTTRSTAVALPMGIVELRIDSVVRLGETRCRIVKRAQGSKLADRAAIYPAIVLEEEAWAIDRGVLAEAIDLEEPEGLAEAIEGEDLAEALEAVETGAHLGEEPEDTTDQAHAPTAAEVLPAWDLAEAAAAAAVTDVAAADGGGRHGRRT
jgi:hypothetical protein